MCDLSIQYITAKRSHCSSTEWCFLELPDISRLFALCNNSLFRMNNLNTQNYIQTIIFNMFFLLFFFFFYFSFSHTTIHTQKHRNFHTTTWYIFFHLNTHNKKYDTITHFYILGRNQKH